MFVEKLFSNTNFSEKKKTRILYGMNFITFPLYINYYCQAEIEDLETCKIFITIYNKYNEQLDVYFGIFSAEIL